MARVRLSEAASADLRAIYRLGLDKFGLRQADAYALLLRNAVKMLGDYPEASPAREGLERPVRVRPCGSHIIVYSFHDDAVHVLRVRHGAEDWIGNPAGDDR